MQGIKRHFFSSIIFAIVNRFKKALTSQLCLLLMGSIFPFEGVEGEPLERGLAIGTLDRFYRASQLQAHLIGQGLMDIPPYLSGDDVDLHYVRDRQLKKEVPFVDSFSIVRFLGGHRADWLKRAGAWDENLGAQSLDYVVRRGDGPLEYRPAIIERILTPYLDAGYRLSDMTLSLVNTPWAIARDGGKEGPWGQREPPADWGVWRATIERLGADIKTLYGSAAAPDFKLGNEYDSRESFDGDEDEYETYFRVAYEALRPKFPRSKIVPGEFTGIGECRKPPACVYDTRSVLTSWRAAQIAPSYVPRSLHALQNRPEGASVAATMNRAIASYARLGAPVIAEIHQFGLLGQPFGAFGEYGSDQGARQAAWEFEVLMGLKQSLKPRRVFHWETFDSIAGAATPFMNGAGFVRLVLDRYLRSEITRLPSSTDRSGQAETLAVAMRSTSHKALIVAAFSLREEPQNIHIRVALPDWMRTAADDLKVIRYSEGNTVHSAIKSDIEAEGNLKIGFELCRFCTSQLRFMAEDIVKLRAMVQRNTQKYVEKLKETLRFKPASDDSGITPSAEFLDIDMAANEIVVLEKQ